MPTPESLDVPPPAPLRRTHSLEFQNTCEFHPRVNDLDRDIHAAVQLIEEFDVDKFLHDVTTPRNQELRNGDLIQGVNPFTTILTESRAVSEASDDSASTRVDDKTPNAEGSDDAHECKKNQRKSRKEEIKELRESIKELTEQLEELKAHPPQESEVPGQSCSSALVKRSGSSLWKFAAMRQLERRRKAEEDNVALREMLGMQVQEATCLQRILKRRTKIQMMEDMLGMKRRKTARVASAPSDNAHIFSKMLRETDGIYAHVETHFANKCVNSLPCPSQTRKVDCRSIDGVVIEMTMRNLLPFSFCKTVKAAQVVLNDLGSHGLKRIKEFDKMIDFHAQESEKSRDTLAVSYFSATPGNENVSGAQVRKVMRTYKEEGCAVYIWKMVAELKLKGSNKSVGYQLQSTLQVVMRPGETPTISGDDSTQLLIHFSASRVDLGMPINDKFRDPGHMESGIGLWEKLISSIPHEIESELVDDLCGANSTNAAPLDEFSC